MIAETAKRIKTALSKVDPNRLKEWNQIKAIIKDTTSKYLYEKTNRNPVILPIIMEV